MFSIPLTVIELRYVLIWTWHLQSNLSRILRTGETRILYKNSVDRTLGEQMLSDRGLADFHKAYVGFQNAYY
jgi:hypothetical protein